ncbi:MAG: hypothetical protein IKM94_00265 [Alphaproteobacteria bacterium]|nr:hypothetical protein [Alphaproteobacteria bacterium]
MLSVKEQKDIVDLVKDYKRAHLRLVDHYNSRSAHNTQTMCLKQAEKYFDTMNRMIANNPDTLTNTDIQCFALLIDGFEQMRRNHLLGELQKYASFDVQAYVGAYNRNGFFKNAKNVTEMSPGELKQRQKKYLAARAKIKKNPTNTRAIKHLDNMRDEVLELSHAVVNKTVKLTPEYASAALELLETVGIIDDKKTQAIDILDDWLRNNNNHAVKENVEPKKSWFGKLKDKFNSWHDEKKSAREKVIELKRKEEQHDARRANFEQAMSVLQKTVSGVVGEFQDVVQSGVKTINEKHTEIKAGRDEKKRNREIIRDAEKTSREHWKNLKKQQQSKSSQEPKRTKKYFWSGWVSVVAAGALLAGFLKIGVDAGKQYQNDKQVKKEVKVKPVAQNVKQQVAPTVDSAYVVAMKNYYNSSMDIIAGQNKKEDVLRKLENQIQSGNIVVNDSVMAERVAYAYFMYREYGFKIDVLELAVNSNEKLTDAQNAELIQVVLNAGERGTGVKKMAQQRVESRGGSLGKHSKFEHATRAQQRAYLVSRGVLKKVQHNR